MTRLGKVIEGVILGIVYMLLSLAVVLLGVVAVKSLLDIMPFFAVASVLLVLGAGIAGGVIMYRK